MKKKVIRVLVVDDHPIVRFGLCTQINLDAGMQVVAEAVDGMEAVEMAHKYHPDVILMDLVMPRMDGVEAITAITKENPQIRILVLTSFAEDERIYAAIRAGALGFIYKDKYPEEMLQAIRDTYHGLPRINPALTRQLLDEMHAKNRAPSRPELTRREFEILELVAKGMLYKEIARKLNIRETTVRTHVSSMLKKLNLDNRSQLVLYALHTKLIQ